jgi:UDP-GlcNAc:undecaprenyl-phosphate/decaprenyl-phosphate GlcNAc-1-phosphate transferase
MVYVAFPTALVISLIAIRWVKNFSHRLGLVAAPRGDRWHTQPTSKVGGIGIFIAFGVTSLVLVTFTTQGTFNWPLFSGIGIMFLLGVIDDIKRLSPPAKLVGELIAAAIVVFFGRNIDFFQLEIINILFTFFWLIGITNAINLLDNMDGLAGGVSIIAAGVLSFFFWQSQTTDLLIIALALGGGVLGFLFYNFPPASIFMGDSGSLFIGFTLAALAIARVPQASDVIAVLGVPTLIFLLPILDTSLVTVTRILRGQSPAHGGRDHTSHRLIAFGLSERQAVMILYGVAILAGSFGIILESIDYAISLVLIPILLVTLSLLTAYLGRLKVVDPKSAETSNLGFTSLVIELTYRGRILEILFDLIIFSIAYYLAFWIHFGSLVDILNLGIFLNSLPIALAGSYFSFFGFGIYRGVWQYLGIRDLLRYSRAVIGAVIFTALVMAWVYNPLAISYRIFVIFAILLFLGLVISRSSFTILDQIYRHQTRDQHPEVPILIYGAGDLGIRLIQWLSQENKPQVKPIGFIDNDPYKRKRIILGIPVVGDINDVPTLLASQKVGGILVSAEDSLTVQEKNQLINICQTHGIWLKKSTIQLELIE